MTRGLQCIEFAIGDDRYVVDAGRVLEVLPLVRWTESAPSDDGVVGLFDFHGRIVPVLDLALRFRGRATRPSRQSRILLAVIPGPAGAPAPCGLVAERVLGVARRDPAAFRPVPGGTGPMPGVGAVTSDESGIVQCLDLDTLRRREAAPR